MWRLVWSPIRFFEDRRSRPPDWRLALAAPALCAGLQLVSALLLVGKTQPLLDALFVELDVPTHGAPLDAVAVIGALASATTYPVYYVMMAISVICIDVLAGRSGHAPRLAEFAGLCFFSQVLFAGVTLAVAVVWEPEAIRLPAHASMSDVPAALELHRAAADATPLISTKRILSYYSTMWLVALLCICLKVVSGFSPRATYCAGAVLLVIFVAVPLLGRVFLA